jgi:CDP-diacylglycerol--glycerol-3-phosphate 3-phosphatidyltransferase
MKFIFSPPNQLTFLRILLTPVFLVVLFTPDPVVRQWSIVIYTIAALTDWYDGWLARRWGYVTRWGAFLDPLADKILTSAALLGFLALGLVPGWAVWAIVIRDAVITVIRSYAEFKGRTFDTSKMAKTKTFAQMLVIYYILILYVGKDAAFVRPAADTFRSLLGPIPVGILVALVALLTVVSGVLYVIANRITVRELFTFSGRMSESE